MKGAGQGPLIGPAAPPGVHLMTWNVRRPLPFTLRAADRWTRRAPRLAALLRAERPTVLGVQEALPSQVQVIEDALGGGYRHVGRGRARDGSDEGCPIFYDAERLDLVEAQQQALSDRPDAPGSRSWGNLLPRIMVVAVFQDRMTSRRFCVINTHLDHLSRRSRLRSAEAIRRAVIARALPAVVMGDLNEGVSGAAVAALLRDDLLVDASADARRRVGPRLGTWSNYRPPREGGRRIDWVFVSGGVQVTRAAINDRRYDGGWGSDHLPVQAEILVGE